MKIDFSFLDEAFKGYEKFKGMMLHMKEDLPKGDFVNFMQKKGGRVFIVTMEEFSKIISEKRYIISKRMLTSDEYSERKIVATLLPSPINIKEYDALVVAVGDKIEEHLFWMMD